MNEPNQSLTPQDELASAQAIARILDNAAQHDLDPSIARQLNAGCERALAQAHVSLQHESGVMRLATTFLKDHRLMAPVAMACSALLIAFLVTQQLNPQDVNGDGDAFLLASDLPPEAYFDKGFDQWLADASQQSL